MRPSLEDVYLDLVRRVMSAAQLAFKEFSYERKRFWRDPKSVFATVALPLLYLIILVTNFGNDKVTSPASPGR